MSKLSLKLNLFLEDDPNIVVHCNIYNVKDIKKGKRNILLPLGRFQKIELDPGDYIVEVLLPSGGVLTEDITLKKSEIPQKLLIQAKSSPREWLTWQQFVGNVEQKEYRNLEMKSSPTTQQEVKVDLVSAFSPNPVDQDDLGINKIEKQFFQGFFFQIPSIKEINYIDPLSTQSPFNNINNQEFYVSSLKPDRWDSISEVYIFNRIFEKIIDSDHMIDKYRNEDYLLYQKERIPRQYLFFRGQDILTQYCVLPNPWIDIREGNISQVEVLFYHTTAEYKRDLAQRVSVLVRDSLFSAALGYLGTGNISSVVKMIDQDIGIDGALRMLRDKISNPLSAAAGAYILLSSKSVEDNKLRDWPKWVENLKNWFLWLPDGAIQHAWTLLLKTDVSRKDKEEARRSLLEGFRRGLPYYSKGVKLLLDGLRLFVNEAKAKNVEDIQVKEALDVVWSLSSRIDVRQPFTTVML